MSFANQPSVQLFFFTKEIQKQINNIQKKQKRKFCEKKS